MKVFFMNKNIPTNLNKDYIILINEVKYLLDKAKSQAYKAVDNIRVQTYWQIGERITRGRIK